MAIDFSTRGPPGADGNSLLWFRRDPNASDGRFGDTALNLNTTLLFAKDETGIWQPQFELRGKRGPNGLPGPQGFGFLSGVGEPASAAGRDGDYYLRDTNAGPLLYGPKTFGSWGSPDPLIGLVMGLGPPQPTDGFDGQVYLDRQNAVFYGQKVGGVWPAPTPLIGLLAGSGAPNAGFGYDGQVYLDVAGQRVYGPKTNGAWPTGMSFTGSAGLQTIAPWATGTVYTVGPPASFVSQGGASYACRVSHTAGVFATDLGAGKWGLVAAKGQDGNGTGTVSTTGSVTAGRLAVFADNTGTLIADGGAPLTRGQYVALALGPDSLS